MLTTNEELAVLQAAATFLSTSARAGEKDAPELAAKLAWELLDEVKKAAPPRPPRKPRTPRVIAITPPAGRWIPPIMTGVPSLTTNTINTLTEDNSGQQA